MAILLVTYDLNAQGQDYQAVTKYFQQYAYAKVLKSAWLIETDKVVEQVHNEFSRIVDANDTYLVTRVFQSEFKGYLNKNVVDWIDSPDRRW